MIAIIIGIILSVCYSPVVSGQDQPAAKYLILISIDGLNPEWYQDDTWPMPFLQQKAREGAYARRARAVYPSATRPGHTTLITGWLPANHGVYNNNIPYNLEDGSSLFHAVNSAGGSVASVGWVGSNNAPTDYIVLGIEYIDLSGIEIHRQERGYTSAVETGEIQGPAGRYERYIAGTVRDAQLASIGISFIERYQPNFMALRFNDTDATQHRYGRDGAAVRGIVASTDLALEELEAAVDRAGIKDQTYFVVTGDHGMDEVHTTLRPNVWLDKSDLGAENEVYFEVFGGSAFLQGADEQRTNEVVSMLESLPDSLRSVFTIMSRDKLSRIGSDPRASLALNAQEGYDFNSSWEEPEQYPNNRRPGSHGGMPTPEFPNNYTGFVIWGPGINSGVVLDEIGIEDVAPTAAVLMGVELGKRDGLSQVPVLRGVK